MRRLRVCLSVLLILLLAGGLVLGWCWRTALADPARWPGWHLYLMAEDPSALVAAWDVQQPGTPFMAMGTGAGPRMTIPSDASPAQWAVLRASIQRAAADPVLLRRQLHALIAHLAWQTGTNKRRIEFTLAYAWAWELLVTQPDALALLAAELSPGHPPAHRLAALLLLQGVHHGHQQPPFMPPALSAALRDCQQDADARIAVMAWRVGVGWRGHSLHAADLPLAGDTDPDYQRGLVQIGALMELHGSRPHPAHAGGVAGWLLRGGLSPALRRYLDPAIPRRERIGMMLPRNTGLHLRYGGMDMRHVAMLLDQALGRYGRYAALHRHQDSGQPGTGVIIGALIGGEGHW